MKIHITSKFSMKEQIKFKKIITFRMIKYTIKYLWDDCNNPNQKISEGFDTLQKNIITTMIYYLMKYSKLMTKL